MVLRIWKRTFVSEYTAGKYEALSSILWSCTSIVKALEYTIVDTTSHIGSSKGDTDEKVSTCNTAFDRVSVSRDMGGRNSIVSFL